VTKYFVDRSTPDESVVPGLFWISTMLCKREQFAMSFLGTLWNCLCGKFQRLRIPENKVSKVRAGPMENRPIKIILLIEDRPEEARLIREMLSDKGSCIFKLAHVASMNDAEIYLAGNPVDVVLVDLGLPDPHGLEAVRRVRAAAPRVSIVLLTSPDDEAIAVQAMQEGAQDYLIKSQIEPRELMRALRNAAARKTLEEALFLEKERAQLTLDCIGDAVICTDLSGKITFLNPVAERMTGWPIKEATGQELAVTFHVVDAFTRKVILDPMAKATAQNRTGELPLNSVLIRRDGFEVSIEDSVAPIRGREGQVGGAVIVFRDVTATRKLEERLTHSAEHDTLTGLPNRMLLNDRLSQAIALARRQKGLAAVLFLDLDGFKEINDSLGHLIGDQVLQSVSKRMLDCVRGPDTVSRQGGDEFIVLLQELKHPDDATTTARRLLDTIGCIHSIERHQIYVTASIGVSIYPFDGEDAETLVKSADTAMYRAKKLGKHCHQFFKPEMVLENAEHQSIEQDLALALEKNEFKLYYQPKVDLRTRAVVGAEALLRWVHPTRGVVSPTQFIPIAEESGLMPIIGAWVLREACTRAKAWADAGEPAKTVAVNISWIQLQNEDFLENLFATLEATGLNPASLELDISESILMRHTTRMRSILTVLRNRGIKVSADNFGIGHSTFRNMQKLPLNALKMDRSLVHRGAGNAGDPTRVIAVLDIAQTLNVRVIADGVETSEDLASLWPHNCDEALGYYFGPPAPPEQFNETFRSQRFSNGWDSLSAPLN
jgi:diguanylate cyclase (GGDEF)-like protein/PAS domain S-box-containing protein